MLWVIGLFVLCYTLNKLAFTREVIRGLWADYQVYKKENA